MVKIALSYGKVTTIEDYTYSYALKSLSDNFLNLFNVVSETMLEERVFHSGTGFWKKKEYLQQSRDG